MTLMILPPADSLICLTLLTFVIIGSRRSRHFFKTDAGTGSRAQNFEVVQPIIESVSNKTEFEIEYEFHLGE